MEKKNLVMVCLCAAIAIMAVAYAAFSTTLTVNGTINATGNFAVEYVETGTCTGTKVGQQVPTGTITKETATGAKLAVKLYTPGDVVTCTIQVKNTGNLAARLNGAHAVSNSLTGTSTPIAVTATSTKTQLAANATDTITVTVKYNWTAQTQPTSGTSANFTVTSNYVQDIQ